MSDVQRWWPDIEGYGLLRAVMRLIPNDLHPEDEYVTFADHVAAVAAAEQRIRTHEGCADAEQRGREEAYNEIPAIAVYGERLRSEGYDVGYTDALAAAREVVAALMPGHCSLLDPSTGYNVSIVTDAVRKDEALAAIDALRTEKS